MRDFYGRWRRYAVAREEYLRASREALEGILAKCEETLAALGAYEDARRAARLDADVPRHVHVHAHRRHRGAPVAPGTTAVGEGVGARKPLEKEGWVAIRALPPGGEEAFLLRDIRISETWAHEAADNGPGHTLPITRMARVRITVIEEAARVEPAAEKSTTEGEAT